MRKTTIAAIPILAAALLALAGCGGSTMTGAAAPKSGTVKAHPTPVESNPDVGLSSSQQPASQQQLASQPSGGKSHNTDEVSSVHGKKSKATPSTASHRNDVTPGTPNPCQLVSLPEARSMAGPEITMRVEAPLGPTCIYKGGGSEPGVTLAVETASFTQMSHQLGKRKQIVLEGRKGYCGHLGTQMLLVPLARGQLLSVAAPCRLAQRFAVKALHRLSA
jgi:hypothetical protein